MLLSITILAMVLISLAPLSEALVRGAWQITYIPSSSATVMPTSSVAGAINSTLLVPSRDQCVYRQSFMAT